MRAAITDAQFKAGLQKLRVQEAARVAPVLSKKPVRDMTQAEMNAEKRKLGITVTQSDIHAAHREKA